MKISEAKINFLGDSITEGTGASCADSCFVKVIEKETGAVCRNYGIGGTRIAAQRSPSQVPHWDKDFCSRAGGMDPDADVIVVFGGTNDYGHGDAPIGSMADRTPETFYGALHYLYTTLIDLYPDSLILVVTPLHRVNEDDPRGDGRKTQDSLPLKGYVEIIREVAEYYSLPVADLYKESGLQPNIPAVNQRCFVDGLHPNDRGHRAIANQLIYSISELLRRRYMIVKQ